MGRPERAAPEGFSVQNHGPDTGQGKAASHRVYIGGVVHLADAFAKPYVLGCQGMHALGQQQRWRKADIRPSGVDGRRLVVVVEQLDERRLAVEDRRI